MAKGDLPLTKFSNTTYTLLFFVSLIGGCFGVFNLVKLE